jgi:hypothetical protein
MSPSCRLVTCRVVHIAKRENPIVNRLSKTKVERVVDHEAERIERAKRENVVKRAAAAVKVCRSLPRGIRSRLLNLSHLILAEKGRSRAR